MGFRVSGEEPTVLGLQVRFGALGELDVDQETRGFLGFGGFLRGSA